MNRKILTKILIASMLAGGINIVPAVVSFDAGNLKVISVANAEVKMVTVNGSAGMSFGDNDEKVIQMVKNAARMNAVQAAKDEAGVYVKSYSKSVNGVLTDDDISAYTSNNIKIISENYKRDYYNESDMSGNLTGNVGFKYVATVTAEIDTSNLSQYVRRDEKEKSALVEQVKSSQKNIAEINKNIEDLNETAKNKTSAEIQTEVQNINNEILAQQKLDEGNKLYYQRQFTQAVEALNESLKYNPKSTDALLKLGSIYQLNLTDKDKAFEYFKKVVEIDENNINAWTDLGTIYKYHFHNEQKGLECYNKSIEAGNKLLAKNPNNLKVLWRLGISYSILGDNKKAHECYQKAVEIEPNNKTAWHLFGNFYSTHLKNYNKAIECFNKSLEIDPNYIFAWQMLGNTYRFRLKDYNKAIEYYNKILEIDSQYVFAYSLIAGAYKDMGDSDKALEYYNKAVEVTPEDIVAWRWLGDFYKKSKKNIFKAAECYQKALEIAPKDGFLWSSLGHLYYDMKNYDGAAECFTKCIEISPKSGVNYQMRGFCYQSLGDKEKAKADFAKAKELGYNG